MDLLGELAVLRGYVRGERTADPEAPGPGAAADTAADTAAGTAADAELSTAGLDLVQAACGLSDFERSLLLLACGPSLMGTVARELAEHTGMPHLCFGTALALLPGAHWSATAPTSGLRHWLLLAPEDPGQLMTSRLVVDERILHQVAGLDLIDDRLRSICWPAPVPTPVARELPAAWTTAAERLGLLWDSGAVRVTGVGAPSAAALAGRAAAHHGRRLWQVSGTDLATGPQDAARQATLMAREVRLGDHAFQVDLTGVAGPAADRWARLLSAVPAVVLIGTEDSDGAAPNAAHTAMTASTVTTLRVPPPTHAERDRREGTRARAGVGNHPGWEDLVLPAGPLEQLRALAATVDHRGTVLDRWGFAARRQRGLGTSALFSGASGTGKTFAAEVLAGGLGRELVQVDLSQVVSKYIGETEKQLARLFDAAEQEGSVLFFDEADALFGKRTAVKDSHDRYANIEVSYLLQRLESFTGLAVLASNARSALDTAFLRRLTTVVVFPHPDAGARLALWQRAFPAQMPRGDLDLARLSRIDATGATIMAAALSGAYLAAEAQQPVDTEHVLKALDWELAKTGRMRGGS